MKPLYSQEDFNKAKIVDLLPCECKECKNTFYLSKHRIRTILNPNSRTNGAFCSSECFGNNKNKKQIVQCTNCNVDFEKTQIEINRSLNNFCSRSCSATYNNKNKKHGTRRSKLEIWLETELNNLYPNLEIHFNRKDTIGSELDIFVPKLNVAFELNGLFHYEPIFGNDKLNKIQNNDKNKFQLCLENKINLCIIDTSNQSYFKPSTSQKYLEIITNIINERF